MGPKGVRGMSHKLWLDVYPRANPLTLFKLGLESNNIKVFEELTILYTYLIIICKVILLRYNPL